MPKFYVQCGPVRTILIAKNASQAAMASLDRTLQTHLWIYDDPKLSEQDCREHLMLEALLHLAPIVQVSERGFDRDDLEFGVPELILRWHQLMVGMNRLFAAAGLAPRSMVSVGGADSQPRTVAPKRPR